MRDFKNILVVRTDRMGDVVLTIPAIRALRHKFPCAKISLWVDPSTRELVDGLPFIDEFILENRSAGWWGYLSHIRTLRKKKFDLAVIYHTKKHTNLACFLAGIPYRLGYKNKKYGFLLNHPVKDRRHLGTKHEVEYCMDLLEDIGAKDGDLDLQVTIHKGSEEWADRYFREKKLTDRPVIALHPSASCPTRLWPTKSYAELAQRLIRENDVYIMIVGGADARPAAEAIKKTAGNRVFDLTGETTLSQLTSILKRCQGLVSNDSGPVHVGAAIGIPVISLFLRSQAGINPQRWRPLGKNSVLLQNENGEEILLDAQSHVISGKFDSISVNKVLLRCQTSILGILRMFHFMVEEGPLFFLHEHLHQFGV
ncbi:MAG: glycosyltransferase family 9 protein [Candidatus Omnitrophica bacterium]|nr:glycosyltransferase family 9 protein [Candidatus Omnitrophota bacterium]MDD5488597.1 glycosyltransferase family 9 protein [Candidatus Omnitrophota bacterium]